MRDPGYKPELRDRETIRAYLEELLRLKAPIQMELTHGNQVPFETTLEKVSLDNFATTTTLPLEMGQVLTIAFMVDSRRFTSHTKVLTRGVFSLPVSLKVGERRAQPRGAFDRSDRAEAFAVEAIVDTICCGRTLRGKVLDLSPQGMRVALEEMGSVTGPATPLKVGDVLGSILIRDLPFSPPIHCGGTIAHIDETCAGLALVGLSEGDQKIIERILARRFPATFGQAFPAKKRKTDVADEAGAPTPVKIKPKAAEVVEMPPELAPPPPPRPERPAATPIMRLRKPGRKILFLSTHPGTHALAEAMREDGFKQVFEAKSFLEAQNQASHMRFDLLFLDLGAGGHWGVDMMRALRSRDLLQDVPIILLADSRKDGALALAEAMGALHVHERGATFEELVPVLYPWLLRDAGYML